LKASPCERGSLERSLKTFHARAAAGVRRRCENS
jgi:hypothetical protein